MCGNPRRDVLPLQLDLENGNPLLLLKVAEGGPKLPQDLTENLDDLFIKVWWVVVSLQYLLLRNAAGGQ